MGDDIDIYRYGHIIAKWRVLRGGKRLLYKPQPLREHHIMKMTGAPGWDARAVDETFPPGVSGILGYNYGDIRYVISIESFREHMFEKEITGQGKQYHCALKHYEPKARVDPQRPAEDTERSAVAQTPPTGRLVCGEVMLCRKCKGTGKEPLTPKRCEFCQGLGVTKLPSTSPTNEQGPATSTFTSQEPPSPDTPSA